MCKLAILYPLAGILSSITKEWTQTLGKSYSLHWVKEVSPQMPHSAAFFFDDILPKLKYWWGYCCLHGFARAWLSGRLNLQETAHGDLTGKEQLCNLIHTGTLLKDKTKIAERDLLLHYSRFPSSNPEPGGDIAKILQKVVIMHPILFNRVFHKVPWAAS